jgi:6-phospho-beta-glucosidase
MSDHVRLAVIGGSGASTPELIDAVAEWPGGEARRPALDIVLQGRSAAKLDVVAAACRQRLPTSISGVRVSTETSTERAVEGADIVLVQVRIGGLDARVFDETFPRAYGIPGEETMGPGGFANAVRTVPALAPLWDRLVALAPEAFIINLTNPAGIVAGAATAHTPRQIVSLCDGPKTFVDAIATATARDADEVRREYAGLNHVGFWHDPDPGVLLAAMSATKGVDERDVEALGAVPSVYVRFYLHPDRELAAQLAAEESRAQTLKHLEAEMLDQYRSGVDAAQHKRRGALWYRVSIVPLIDAVVHGASHSVVLGLPNRGAVPWAPDDAMVELATMVEAGGALRRLAAPAPSPAALGWLERHAAFETRTAQALAGTRSLEDVRERRDELVAALSVNPMVPSADLAARVVDEILVRSPR